MKWLFLLRSGHKKKKKKKRKGSESWLAEQFSADTLKASKRSFLAVSSNMNYSDLLWVSAFLFNHFPEKNRAFISPGKQTVLNFHWRILGGLTLMSMCLRRMSAEINQLSSDSDTNSNLCQTWGQIQKLPGVKSWYECCGSKHHDWFLRNSPIRRLNSDHRHWG